MFYQPISLSAHCARWGRPSGDPSRLRFGRATGTDDFDVLDRHRLPRLVVTIARHPCDRLHYFLVSALAKDGVATVPGVLHRIIVEALIGDLRDEELAAVGIPTSIRIGQAARDVELQRWRDLVLELVAGIAGAITPRVSALDHEFGDHAMERGAVIQGNACFLGTARTRPFLGALGKADEVLDADLSLVR